MDDYICKPIRAEELQRVLGRWQPASPLPTEDEPTAGSEPHSPPVDLEQLRAVVGQDEQEMRELVELYFHQTAGDLTRLKAAISTGSLRDIERIAHGCAGASANCGMVGMVPLLRKLEHAARENRLTDGGELCAAVAQALERIKDFFQAYKLPT